ncbi:hypothetical protein GCM10027043_52490 [Ferruginibacter profundus]
MFLVVTGCKSTKPFSCIWYNPLDYAYDSLTTHKKYKDIEICGSTYKNKDNGALFQDIRRLTLNCDSTFTWKHISCISKDSSFGRWTLLNNTGYLKTSDKLKRKIIKQNKQDLGEMFGDYIDLTNTSLTFSDSFVVWQRSTTWTDTLYRR